LQTFKGELMGFTQMTSPQNSSATPISNPIVAAALSVFTVSGERAGSTFKVEGRTSIEPGEPGRAANGGSGSL